MAVHLIIDQSNVIVNRIEWDGIAEYQPPEGTTVVVGDGEMGWSWNGKEAVDPNPSGKPADSPSDRVTVSD